MLDTLSYSDSLKRDLHADRTLAESFTFSESISAARQGWFTRVLSEVLSYAEQLTYTGVGLETGTTAALRKLVRASKEFCLSVVQRIRGYGVPAPTDADRLDRDSHDFSKKVI